MPLILWWSFELTVIFFSFLNRKKSPLRVVLFSFLFLYKICAEQSTNSLGDLCVLGSRFFHHFEIVGCDGHVRIMDTTYLHIGMILSTLGLSPHGFALGLYPKGLIPMEIFVHPYIPMILPISSQCGTLVVYPTLFIYQSFYYTHILFNISCSIFFIYIFYLLSFYYQLIKYYL